MVKPVSKRSCVHRKTLGWILTKKTFIEPKTFVHESEIFPGA